jgi:DNA polymerase-1
MPETKTKKRLVLLDSHAILHRAYHALPEFSSKKGEPTGALYGLVAMLIKIIEELKPDYVVATFDLPGATYRHDAYKQYKAHRKELDNDLSLQINRSRDIFKALNIPLYEKPGFEADDMLGTIVEEMKAHPDVEIVVASGDMDTLQLVEGKRVLVYTLKKGIKDTVLYDEKGVKERFGFEPTLLPDYKGLRGDTSDNIIGIAGIGEKTATTLIGEFGSIEDIYKALEKKNSDEKFKKAGISPRIIELLKNGKEEAEFSKMLATIRRDAPINFKLPEKEFCDSIEIEKATALFAELDFRTLGARLKTVLGMKVEKEPLEEKAQASTQAVLMQSVDPLELKKTELAFWLLNSERTNPGLEEILEFTNTQDFNQARDIIFNELAKRGLTKVYEEIELPLMPVLKKMEVRGVKIDIPFLKELGKTYHKELARLEKEIWKHAGVEFNIGSPKQLGEILFDKLQLTAKGLKKTEGGARSTRESELEKLRESHPIVPLIFEYRELAKLLSTYIDPLPNWADENDRVHTHFIQTGAATGRMATTEPAVQNIPIKTELGRAIRKAFIAEKGFVLSSIDYSQIELRIAAFMSGDKKLIDIFKNNIDVHTAVAAEVFEVPLEKVDKEMRRKAKVINFGILYGMGVTALKQNLGEGTSRAEAQEFYNNYFKKFDGLAKYVDEIKADVERKGYTETFFGRRRYFEGINSKIPYIKAMAERMAVNAPFQGTNADIIKIAMKHIDDWFVKNGYEKDAFLLLQVHDELVLEVRTNLADKIIPEVKKIMETVVDPKDTKGVICAVNAATGKSWGDMK